MSMNPRQHARLARALIDACGGLAEASEACGTSKSVLSTYQNPEEHATMSARVIADLEAYCGEPLYSRALFEARPSAADARDLLDEACEAAEAVAGFQRKVRLATRDGQITPRERDDLARTGAEAVEQLREAVEGVETFQGLPKGRARA